MSSQIPMPPADGNPLNLVLWRLVEAEKSVASLDAWREQAREQIVGLKEKAEQNVTREAFGMLAVKVDQNTRGLRTIGAITTGTFLAVVGAIVTWFAGGGFHH